MKKVEEEEEEEERVPHYPHHHDACIPRYLQAQGTKLNVITHPKHSNVLDDASPMGHQSTPCKHSNAMTTIGIPLQKI